MTLFSQRFYDDWPPWVWSPFSHLFWGPNLGGEMTGNLAESEVVTNSSQVRFYLLLKTASFSYSKSRAIFKPKPPQKSHKMAQSGKSCPHQIVQKCHTSSVIYSNLLMNWKIPKKIESETEISSAVERTTKYGRI